MKKLLLSFLVLLCSLPLSAQNWDHLFDYSQYQNAKISPDGKHLAVSFLHQGKTALAFLTVDTMKMVGLASFGGKSEVGSYYWVNNERVVFKLVQRVPSKEKPQFFGELYATNIDGSKNIMIYGYRAGEMQTGSRLKKKEATYGWGEIIDILPSDPKHILISSTPMSKEGERLPTALKLNVYSGKIKKKLGRSPVSLAKFWADQEGSLKAVVGVNKHDERVLYIRKERDWHPISQDIVTSDVYPISIDETGKYLFTLDNPNQDLTGVFKLNLETLEYTNLYTDKVVDVTHFNLSSDGSTVYAARVDDGYPAYLLLDKQHEEAKVFKDLLASFPYSQVAITSRSEDGSLYVIRTNSDIDPGSLYLFNRENNSAKQLFKFKPKVDSNRLAQTEPVKVKASDGQILHGYFTKASSDRGKPAPAVVLVHGGPHGARDYWYFSSQVQYLALNGYSVLQINYRGSGGYGESFGIQGHQRWGSTIQQDIHDAYQWLLAEKKASSACIMGASFGGYSAVQSAVLYPDSYKCAVANAGIYDLQLMFDEGDIQTRQSGMSYLKRVLGEDQAKLKVMSPVHHVNKLKIPLLLAHGEEDERAPFEHAKRLRKALDKAGKTYEWFAVDKEGHGFFNPDNQKAYMKKVVEFLDKNLAGS